MDDTTDTTLGASGVGAGGAGSDARERMLGIENRAPVIELPPASAAGIIFGSGMNLRSNALKITRTAKISILGARSSRLKMRNFGHL